MRSSRLLDLMVSRFVLRGKYLRSRPIVFSTAPFCQWAVGIAEEGSDCELVVEEVVLGELGAVVEGDGFAQAGLERSEPGEELVCGVLRGLAGLPCQQGHTGLPFVRDEDGFGLG